MTYETGKPSAFTWRRWNTHGAYGEVWRSRWHIVRAPLTEYEGRHPVSRCGIQLQFTMFPDIDPKRALAKINPGEPNPYQPQQCKRCTR
jgi:hypothetical protein